MSKQSFGRRHFRAFVLWTVGGTLLMQLALGSAIDVALMEVRDPEYAHRQELLRERLAENDGKPVVVVLGSSRVYNGVDSAAAAHALDHAALVFNFGIPGSGPFLESVWLDRLRASGLKPDVALIEINPVHYNDSRPSPEVNILDGARLAARELTAMSVSFETLTGPMWRWAVGRVTPGYRHQAELHERLGIDQLPNSTPDAVYVQRNDAFGWQPRFIPTEQHAGLTRLAHQTYDDSFRDFTLSRARAQLLEENLRHCRKEGIRAALLLAPEGSEFRALYSPAMTAALDGMLADLSERYGVPVIDARAWMDDAAFCDMHHLLPDGAGTFAKRLAREGIAPLLRERSRFAESGAGNPWQAARRP